MSNEPNNMKKYRRKEARKGDWSLHPEYQEGYEFEGLEYTEHDQIEEYKDDVYQRMHILSKCEEISNAHE